jgi:hypothetical protein
MQNKIRKTKLRKIKIYANINMKIELFIFGITAFLIYNTYHDGKYTKVIMSWKKYFQMGFFALIGISIYLLMKRNPAQCKNMLMHANNVVKYMPIDRSSMGMLNPILDFTAGAAAPGFMESFTGEDDDNLRDNGSSGWKNFMGGAGIVPGEKRLLQSGKGTKRSVSETKKKYVASQQNWKCGHCKTQLTAWFEVDHINRLDSGGTNEVDNLVALCRDCHGKKTAMENM